MQTYRIVDEATSNEYQAATDHDAVEQFCRRYDTAEMAEGDTFTARVYRGKGLDILSAIVCVTADGKGGISEWNLEAK